MRSLGLFRLEKRRLRGDLIAVFNIFTRGSKGAEVIKCLSLVTTDRTGEIKLCQGMFRVNFRKSSTSRGWLGAGTGSPGKLVTAPTLAELKKLLDNTVRHMVRFLRCPVQGQELD